MGKAYRVLMMVIFGIVTASPAFADGRHAAKEIARYRQQVAVARRAASLRAWINTPGGPPGLRRIVKQARKWMANDWAEEYRLGDITDEELGLPFGPKNKFILLADGTIGRRGPGRWAELRLKDVTGQTRETFGASLRIAIGGLLQGRRSAVETFPSRD